MHAAPHPGNDPRQWVYTTILAESPLQRFRPQAPRTSRAGAVHCAAYGGEGPAANAVMVLGAAAPEEAFGHADTFFGGPGRYSVTVDVEAAPAVDAALRAARWTLDEEEPALVLPLTVDLVIPPPPADLSIRQVQTQADLDAFRAITGTPPSVVPSLASATAPGVGLLIGRVDGADVATSRPVVLGAPVRVVDINGVVTRPEARRRGYATAMTWAAVRFGAAHGARVAVLCATEMGYPVYRKMGFTPVCTFRTYLPPASE